MSLLHLVILRHASMITAQFDINSSCQQFSQNIVINNGS